MSLGPLSSDSFKNMTLLTISNSLPKINSSNDSLPTGDDFQTILQTIVNEQNRANLNQTSPLNGSLLSNFVSSLPEIKDFSQLLGATTSLNFSEVPLERVNSTLKGKLTGLGEQFIEAGRKYNINPCLLASIAVHESGNGQSRAANVKNNIAGMMGQSGLKQYANVQESIFDMARNLRKNYLDEGIDTIAKIGAKYAPVGAANDPTGLNNDWVKGVNSLFHSFLS
jgi:hypothetical protein